MLISVRRGVFETNSSSTHSLTMCSGDEFEKWQRGEILLSDGAFLTKEKAIKELKNDEYFLKYNEGFDFSDEDALADALREYEFYTYDGYWDYHNEYESFEKSFTTKNGDEVVSFGYYG